MTGLLFRVPAWIASHGADHGSAPGRRAARDEEGGGDEPIVAPVILLRPERSDGARAGERSAGARIDDIYRDESLELFRFVRAAVHDQELAEDILQETFLRLVRQAAAGRLPENVHGWLYRVATNLMISGGRRSRIAVRSLPQLVGEQVVRSAEERVLEAERREAVRSALRALRMDARVALLLSAQGFSAREIGTTLGRTDAAVRTLLSRSRLRLREHLSAAAPADAGEVG